MGRLVPVDVLRLSRWCFRILQESKCLGFFSERPIHPSLKLLLVFIDAAM